MGYVNYNIDENYIEVCKGDTRQKVICETSKKNPDISAIYYNNECIGVGIKHFLTESEIEGIKGELIFKKILDESELPYLYVGQSSYGVERSNIIVDKQKSKRPDYLVSFKSIGNILFDVKCRKKLKLLNEDTYCFSMYISEIEALKKMGQSMSLPIWLAFIDKIELDSKNDIDVYIVSIDSLLDYAEKMKLNEEKLNNDSLVAIRLPNELLIKVNINKQIKLDIPKISLETIKKYSKLHINIYEQIKTNIIEIVSSGDFFKSKLHYEFQARNLHYCHPNEVEKQVEFLELNNKITYISNKPLKLNK